jgi:hypothetical protein
MYIPSYDFRIFDIPFFSPLQAQEFGADTTFSASTPISYIDYSFNQLFQESASQTRERLRQVRDEADRLYKQAGGADTQAQIPSSKKSDNCPAGYSKVIPFGIEALSYCGKQRVSDGPGTMGDKEAPAGLGKLETAMNSFPQGSGLFLIAVIAIIFLLLFVRR